MDNEIMLEKLQNLQQLLEDHDALQSYVDGGCARATLAELEEIREEIGTLPKAPSVTSCHVQLPLPADHADVAKAEKKKRKKLLMIVGGVTALLLVIYFASHAQALNTISVLGIFATIIVAWFYKMSNDVYKTKAKELQESQKKYQDTLSKFQKVLSCYPSEVDAGMKEYVQYQLRHYQNYPAFMDKVLGYEDKIAEAQKALETNEALLAQNGVLSEEYYHLVPTIISMLKSGRADSYKEALNMAIQEERQMENERARREEENRRIAAMERQAEEERRHNMAMEQQQEAHNRRMEEAEKARAEQQRRDALQAKRDQEYAARRAHEKEVDAHNQALHRCSKCSKRYACSVRGNPNCGAFDPDPIFKH